MSTEALSAPLQYYIDLRDKPCSPDILSQAVRQFREQPVADGRTALCHADACVELATYASAEPLAGRLLNEADEQYRAGVEYAEGRDILRTRLESRRAFIPVYRAQLVEKDDNPQRTATALWKELVGQLSRTALEPLLQVGGSTIIAEMAFHSLLARRMSKDEGPGIIARPSFSRQGYNHRDGQSGSWNAVAQGGGIEGEQRLWVASAYGNQRQPVASRRAAVSRIALVDVTHARDLVSLVNGMIQEKEELELGRRYGQLSSILAVLGPRLSLAGERLEQKVQKIASKS